MSQTTPTNITQYVIEGEILFQNPYKKGIEFWEIEKKENIYHFTQAIGFKSFQKINLLLKYNTKRYFYGFMLNGIIARTERILCQI